MRNWNSYIDNCTIQVYKLLLLLCSTDEFYVRKESERCLERRKQEQENTNKQQSVEP